MYMKRIKSFLVIFLTIAMARLMYAADPPINFFSNPRWSVELATPVQKSLDYLTAMAALDAKVTLDMTELRCSLGVEVLPDRFSFTTKAFYSPTFFGNFRLGTGTIINVCDNPAYYTETNILLGFFLRFSPCRWFTLKHSIAALEKISSIKTGDSPLLLTYNSMAFDLQVIFHPVTRLTLCARLSNYDEYRYYLFFTPIFTLRAEYDFGRAAIGFGARLHYIDFFTLSGTLSEQEYRIYARINIE